MRVLLVEDDRMIGAAVKEVLQDVSYAADWVQNGQSAMTALSAQHYDLVLLDLGLPGKDGMDVLGSLRATGDPVPVPILTARDALEDRVRGLDAGAEDYLVKPFETAELFACRRAVVRRKSGAFHPVLPNGVLQLDPVTHASPVRLLHNFASQAACYKRLPQIQIADYQSATRVVTLPITRELTNWSLQWKRLKPLPRCIR